MSSTLPSGFYYGDYYPLTPYSQAPDTWLAYQLQLPDANEGLVVAFKRPKSIQTSRRLRLFALDLGASYEVINLDNSQRRLIVGKELMEPGA